MSPVWVCLEILGDFYFMKGLISYNVTSFAFGICLSEVWALKEILEAHYFGLIRSSSSNWSHFTLERKFTCVPLIWPFVHSVRFTLVIVQSTLFIYCFQGVIPDWGVFSVLGSSATVCFGCPQRIGVTIVDNVNDHKGKKDLTCTKTKELEK